jgi:hypothetical protein
MDENQQKEQFSYAYVRAVASVAGYGVHRPEPDDDSVDLVVSARGSLTLRLLALAAGCPGIGEQHECRREPAASQRL